MVSANALQQAKYSNKTVADFFAGIGLVSMGFSNAKWQTIYALDYNNEKAHAYYNHFGQKHYHVEDITKTKGNNVPDVVLAHASFPCTDLSVAGERKGINQGESSAFWQFIRILSEMKKKYGESRPPLVLLENVEGLLTSADGKDLKSVLVALNALNYQVDLLRIDASHFVPQSRVRIFIIGIHDEITKKFNTDILRQEQNLHSSNARSKKIIEYISKNHDIRWYFHSLPHLPERKISLENIIDPAGEWWTSERTNYLYNQLHDRHKKLIDKLINNKKFSFFPAFRRMRMRNGKKQSTVELRTDGIAGCLRTPKGGSARQILVRVGNGSLDARLINEKEAARLMGADDFKINNALSLNQVLFGFGDAVCVPTIEWLAKNYLDNLID
jgi:DNA (cytosine-5)-methyltransferase 1